MFLCRSCMATPSASDPVGAANGYLRYSKVLAWSGIRRIGAFAESIAHRRAFPVSKEQRPDRKPRGFHRGCARYRQRGISDFDDPCLWCWRRAHRAGVVRRGRRFMRPRRHLAAQGKLRRDPSSSEQATGSCKSRMHSTRVRRVIDTEDIAAIGNCGCSTCGPIRNVAARCVLLNESFRRAGDA